VTRRSIGWHQANRRNARAYQRAFRRLAEIHRDEFARILNEERLKAYAEDSTPAKGGTTQSESAAHPEAVVPSLGAVGVPSHSSASVQTGGTACRPADADGSSFTTNSRAANAGAVNTTTHS
jgi:hypothetical protein